MYQIAFTPKAKKQFLKLERKIQQNITKAIDEKLAVNPKFYLKILSGNFNNFYKFRVGNYRLIGIKEEDIFIITIIKIKHRQSSYK